MSPDDAPAPEPTPPFLHIVAVGVPNPSDVVIPDAVATVLIAKGWIPPGTIITFTEGPRLIKPYLRSSN